MNEDYQVICSYGDFTVSQLHDIEKEYILTKIVNACLGKKFFDEIGVAIFDCLVDAALLNFEGVKNE